MLFFPWALWPGILYFAVHTNSTTMIQRIQSLWMLFSALSIALMGKLSLATGTTTNGALQSLFVAERLHLLIISIFLMVLPLIAIFLFKNRTAQKKLIWLHLLLCLLMVLFCWMAVGAFEKVTPAFQSMRYGLGITLPVVAIVFDVLAFRGIRADEKLIKSVDRLR